MKKTLLAASLGLAFFLPSAEAGVFDFSFAMSDNQVLSGKIDGTLQADNNTVLVNSVLDFASFDGIPLPSMTFIGGLQGPSPILSLDGSIMDFLACSEFEPCDAYFHFSRNKGFHFYNTTNDYGDKDNFYPENWSLTSSSESLPVPTALPLMVMGGIVMAFRRRKAV